MSFFDFASVVGNTPDEESDVHFMSMSFLIDHFVGAELGFFLKLEDLPVEWERLEQYGIQGKIEKLKKSNHKPWLSYYDNTGLKGLIRRRYEKDFDTFGYKGG